MIDDKMIPTVFFAPKDGVGLLNPTNHHPEQRLNASKPHCLLDELTFVLRQRVLQLLSSRSSETVCTLDILEPFA